MNVKVELDVTGTARPLAIGHRGGHSLHHHFGRPGIRMHLFARPLMLLSVLWCATAMTFQVLETGLFRFAWPSARPTFMDHYDGLEDTGMVSSFTQDCIIQTLLQVTGEKIVRSQPSLAPQCS